MKKQMRHIYPTNLFDTFTDAFDCLMAFYEAGVLDKATHRALVERLNNKYVITVDDTVTLV